MMRWTIEEVDAEAGRVWVTEVTAPADTPVGYDGPDGPALVMLPAEVVSAIGATQISAALGSTYPEGWCEAAAAEAFEARRWDAAGGWMLIRTLLSDLFPEV